ncbi:MAG: (Fe-S)-binding protein [Pseudomonadota bacterium]
MEISDGTKTSQDAQVFLFVTCLADLLRPSVAFASLALLEWAGYRVTVPDRQTCCAQPAYNNGDYKGARRLAERVIAMLEPADYVVAPSGSCAGMIRHHYPRLVAGRWRDRAISLAGKTYELTAFLADVATLTDLPASSPTPRAVAYHDACAGLREMGVRQQPRKLLRELRQVEVREFEGADVCCGFGGTFCAKMPEISARMADAKLDAALATGASMITGGDLGCLFSLAGRASRRGDEIEIRHVAELLCGDLDSPAIGRPD